MMFKFKKTNDTNDVMIKAREKDDPASQGFILNLQIECFTLNKNTNEPNF